jgi:hypothetical protein
MSKTPRTDEHLRMKEENGHAVIVSRDFARQLETELADKDKQLAEARAEVERKDRLIEQMQGALTKLIGTLEVMSVMPETLGKYPVLAIDAPELEQARAALAAERSECL